MTDSPAKSEHFGTFRTVGARLDDMDDRIVSAAGEFAIVEFAAGPNDGTPRTISGSLSQPVSLSWLTVDTAPSPGTITLNEVGVYMVLSVAAFDASLATAGTHVQASFNIFGSSVATVPLIGISSVLQHIHIVHAFDHPVGEGDPFPDTTNNANYVHAHIDSPAQVSVGVLSDEDLGVEAVGPGSITFIKIA